MPLPHNRTVLAVGARIARVLRRVGFTLTSRLVRPVAVARGPILHLPTRTAG
jgi:hypothetical protein